MVQVRFKGVNRITRKGRAYYYFGRGKGAIRLPDDPTSPAFAVAYERARAQLGRREGGIGDMIARYYQSRAYGALAARTRLAYRADLEIIRELWGAHDPALIDRAAVVRLRDKFEATPRKADKIISSLSAMLTWAAERGEVPTNPAIGVRSIAKSKPTRPWTDAEMKTYRERWPLGSPQRTAFEIGAATGLRIGDVWALKWSNIINGRVDVTQAKTGRLVSVPITPPLAQALAKAPRDSVHVVTNSRGRPYTYESFKRMFADATGAAKVTATFHGLRARLATDLIEAGASPDETAAVTGHSTPAQLRTYTAERDRARLADQAFARTGTERKLQNSQGENAKRTGENESGST